MDFPQDKLAMYGNQKFHSEKHISLLPAAKKPSEQGPRPAPLPMAVNSFVMCFGNSTTCLPLIH